mgnify:CR=1 FL=1
MCTELRKKVSSIWIAIDGQIRGAAAREARVQIMRAIKGPEWPKSKTGYHATMDALEEFYDAVKRPACFAPYPEAWITVEARSDLGMPPEPRMIEWKWRLSHVGCTATLDRDRLLLIIENTIPERTTESIHITEQEAFLLRFIVDRRR